ncbi:methionyl-tRNA formyltransferase [soil metagenome]
MKVVFAGTPEFAQVALARLHAAGFEIPLVLTQPDRPAGRGMKLHASAVKAFALEHGITVAQPRSLRLDGKFPEDAALARAVLEAAHADVMVVAAYGLILPAWVLITPRLGCLNIHASLLPRWGGAAPIHRAIEAGDAETGITIMQMDAGLDTGDMLLTRAEPIGADDSTDTLHDRLAAIGGEMIVEALALAANGSLLHRPQPTDGVSYAHKIEKAEADIDWTLPAATIERRIRAFDAFPGASSRLHGEVIKCWRAEVTAADASIDATPGQIIAVSDAGITVACGSGALTLTQLQRPGGRRLGASPFLQGLQGKPITVGMVFEFRAS